MNGLPPLLLLHISTGQKNTLFLLPWATEERSRPSCRRRVCMRSRDELRNSRSQPGTGQRVGSSTLSCSAVGVTVTESIEAQLKLHNPSPDAILINLRPQSWVRAHVRSASLAGNQCARVETRPRTRQCERSHWSAVPSAVPMPWAVPVV